MKNIKFAFILLSFLAISCSARVDVNNNKVPSWIEGEWKGVGYQLNFPQTWTMELTVKKGELDINYPTLDCSGEWVLVNANAGVATFIEKITVGVDKCVNGGKVIIAWVDKNHISYSYFSPDSGELEAHSTLQNIKSIGTLKS